MTIKQVVVLAAVAAFAACSSRGPSSSLPPAAQPAAARAAASPIEHVVFIVQENRSFNNFFMGYPGATTARYGYNTNGRKIRLRPQALGTPWDIEHSAASFFAACDGTGSLPGTDCKMDGWNKEPTGKGEPKNLAYSYVPRDEIAPYWTMARQYVLADRTFPSNLDGSFVAHQYVVAAYAHRTVDWPIDTWGCEGGPTDTVATILADRTTGPRIRACFDIPTIGGEADKAGLSWRFYAGAVNENGGMWSSFQADRKIYNGPDWSTNVINPSAQFLHDVRHGSLANITWITPTWETSDHPGLNGTKGPAWVTSVVDAIGESKFWKSTTIFIMWDDWGGWFDPVQPVFEDYDGLGFRVPLLMVSPYAKKGSVTHVQYETSSVLRYIEDNFGLPPLAASDARANDPANDARAFDYDQPPRAFQRIAGGKPAEYWMRLERTSRMPRKPAGIIGDD